MNQLVSKMKFLYTLILSCLFSFSISAQDLYQKQLGSVGADRMTDMKRLTDGSYIAWGYSQKGDSSFAQLFKVDSTMNLVWSKTFTFNKQMRTTEFSIMADGSYLLCGRTWQTPAATKQGGFVIKTDASGVTQWTRIIKFDGSETAVAAYAEADGNIRCFVTGATTTHYMKLTAAGVPSGDIVNPTNGTYDMIARKVVRVAAERYAMVGDFTNSPDHILMLNRDTIEWVNEYNGILNVGRLNTLTADAAGNLFFTGDYQAGNYPMRQIFAGKLLQNGVIRWINVLPMIQNGGRGIDTVWRYSMGTHIELSGSRMYVSGSIYNEQKQYSYATISAFDTAVSTAATLNWAWTRMYGSRLGTADSFSRVFVLPNRQLLGVGQTGLGGNTATPNFYFVKTDTAGISSCNYDSYTPVEQITGAAYLRIPKPYIGLAREQLTLASYNDAVPTTTACALSNTSSICSAQICPAGTLQSNISRLAACLYDTITITSSGAAAYNWSSPIMSPSRTDSTFNVVLNRVGTFPFNLSAQPRGNTCFATVSYNVTVNPLPIIGLNAPRFMCSGDSLAVNCGAGSGITLTWSSASNSPWRAGTAQTNIMTKPVTPGVHTYNVRGVTTATGCVNTNSTTITVRDNVTPTVRFEPIGCPGPDLTLRAIGTPEGATPSFDWIIDGVLVNGRREVLVPNAIGKSVQVIMNVGGDVCPLPPSTRQVRSEVKIVSCQGVSTKELLADKFDINVYPNPNDGNFTVKVNAENAKTVSFRIINILGQTVEQSLPRNIENGEAIESFNLANLPTGIYLVETKLDNKRVVSKIQVQ